MEDEDYPGYEEEHAHVCRACGESLDGYRPDAIYCSDACRKRYKRHEQRLQRYRDSYSSDHEDVSLDELYAQIDPSTWHNPRELVDEYEDQDQEPGDFSNIWELNEAVEAVHARYEREMAPYRAQLRRNPGVRPRGLVALERQRDQEIAEMWRNYERADELSRAASNESQRIVRAHERQTERAALQALGNDRYGIRSGRLRQPEFHGRSTHDLWDWS